MNSHGLNDHTRSQGYRALLTLNTYGTTPPESASGTSPTLTGSISLVFSGAAPTDPFRVSFPNAADSGGVAPGYYIDPLRGSDAHSADGFYRGVFSPACRLQGRRYKLQSV